ncbi:MAG: hypothetical protein ACI9BF_000844 [Candidatus Paceibacteria bacterium]|jgi:hypothetical protein
MNKFFTNTFIFVAILMPLGQSVFADEHDLIFGLSIDGSTYFDGDVNAQFLGEEGYNNTFSDGESSTNLTAVTNGTLCTDCSSNVAEAALAADVYTGSEGEAWVDNIDTPLVIESSGIGVAGTQLTVGNNIIQNVVSAAYAGIGTTQFGGTNGESYVQQMGSSGAETLTNYTGTGCAIDCGDGTINNNTYARQSMHASVLGSSDVFSTPATAAAAGTSAATLLLQITRPPQP